MGVENEREGAQMITWLSFVLLSLATFRLTRLIIYDKITAFIRAPFFEMEENGYLIAR
ncbi:hypothetical protein JCM21714_2563 [Gracilibacillus boraciitolerans JCM 21714]|uniref:Uncharacterized protein n=1 Tax=Gracilibacillus boraciitolerans JCM 21714 TaxID=1298598 RepID=W4VKY3_9BACI|nr:hypothetical protein JCM21714_2563 [Gracilibacillus boraciitolerans JCM 21714]